jgi:hypothetical protein
MQLIFRVLMSAVAAIAAFYFIFWMSAAVLPMKDPYWISNAIGLVCAAGAGWYIWSRPRSSVGKTEGTPGARLRLMACVAYGAIAVGAIGFCAGFFGPMIFTPESNQGPLLGILITGPAGFLAGAIGGFMYWLLNRPKT